MTWLFLLKYWRLFAIAGLLLGIGLWHYRETAKAYRQGTQDGQKSALEESAKQIEADTTRRKAELDERESKLSVDTARLQGERAALTSARAGISAALAAGLGQLATQGVDIKNDIQAIPDADINGRFRLSLDRARSAERERAAKP